MSCPNCSKTLSIQAPTKPPQVPPVPHNSFVTRNGSSFMLDNHTLPLVGANAFFLGLLQETMDVPTKAQVTEIFDAAVQLKFTAIRSHTLGITDVIMFNEQKAWDSLDWAFSEAKRTGIKLVVPLTDAYNYYHGSYDVFCKYIGVPKTEFFTSRKSIESFKLAIKFYLGHINKYTGIAIKDSPELAIIELGNELGNYRPNSGSTAIPTRDWNVEITKHIKSIDKNHLVMSGSDECLGGQISNDFSVLEFDCFSSHDYEEDSRRIIANVSRSQAAQKPYILGEYGSNSTSNQSRFLKGLEPAIQGSFAWSIYPHNNGSRVPHNDGFTFWYDNQSSMNTQRLLTISNHCRRMQNLPQVSNIF